MSETSLSRYGDQITGPGQDPQIFGPTGWDIGWYQALLAAAENNSKVGIDTRVNAELTSLRLDERSLGSYVNPEVSGQGLAGLEPAMAMKIAQQRYIASALGMRVGQLGLNRNAHIVSMPVELPDASSLPPRPSRHADGSFWASTGPVETVQADAIYAAHFIAGNRKAFTEPKAFESLFREVINQAEAGQLTVRNRVGDIKGACSMVRQVARVLGYEVGEFNKAGDDTYVMAIPGIKAGFDAKNTHFK